jgi:hypothetical protein
MGEGVNHKIYEEEAIWEVPRSGQGRHGGGVGGEHGTWAGGVEGMERRCGEKGELMRNGMPWVCRDSADRIFPRKGRRKRGRGAEGKT